MLKIVSLIDRDGVLKGDTYTVIGACPDKHTLTVDGPNGTRVSLQKDKECIYLNLGGGQSDVMNTVEYRDMIENLYNVLDIVGEDPRYTSYCKDLLAKFSKAGVNFI